MSKRKIAIGVVAVLLVGGSVWAMMRNRPDSQVEKVKQLQAVAFKEDATPDQRRQNFQLMRQEMDKLKPEQRREVGQQMRENMERQMDKRIAAYFALPKDQRVAYLDKQINDMEKRRKEWESQRNQSGQGQNQANSTQGGGGGGGSGNQPNTRPGGANRSTDAQLQRRDQRLDRSTATQRAMRSSYFADMQQRRMQLGLPPMGGPGGRPR